MLLYVYLRNVLYRCSIVSLDNRVPGDVMEAVTTLDDVREVHAAVITPYFYVGDKEAAATAEVATPWCASALPPPRAFPLFLHVRRVTNVGLRVRIFVRHPLRVVVGEVVSELVC